MKSFRHAVITGASSGIGAALAITLATRGTNVALIGRHEDRLNSVAEVCAGTGVMINVAAIDVCNRQVMDRTLRTWDKQLPIDLVVANAGVSAGRRLDGSAESHADIRRLMEINFFGVLNTVTPVLDTMIQRGHGSIGVMSSLAAFRGLSGTPGYCASKAAVKSYGEALRGRLERQGIGVSVICPGFVTSPMSDRLQGPKPFQMEANRAAALILKGLARNRGTIAFPFLLATGLRALTLLPDPVRDRILRGFDYRVAESSSSTGSP